MDPGVNFGMSNSQAAVCGVIVGLMGGVALWIYLWALGPLR